MSKALIICCPQNDFCSGGSIPVENAENVIATISRYITKIRTLSRTSTFDYYERIIVIRDFHVTPKDHWSLEPDYVTSFPKHCAAGSVGVEIHSELDTYFVSDVLFMGLTSGATSAFQALVLPLFREVFNYNQGYLSLDNLLCKHNVSEIDICGIALESFVKETAFDAIRWGYDTNVIFRLCASINADNNEATLQELRDAGVGLLGENKVSV